MPPSPHTEHHFRSSDKIRDIVIGMSDGLTVPFALAAGLSGAVGSTHIVVAAGLAEIAAGSISMGLGGYLAARSDSDHYVNERAREEREIDEMPEEEAREVEQIFQTYGLDTAESKTVTASLRRRPKAWIDFMMRFELGLEEPDPKRAFRSAATIGGSYAAGGLIPLVPYMTSDSIPRAFYISVAMTLAALFVFGFIKGRITGDRAGKNAVQTLTIGSIAAAAAYLLAKAVS